MSYFSRNKVASFTGSLVGDVTGTQGATVVADVGGETAAEITQAVDDVQAATSANTASTIVKRDASGNIAVSSVIEGYATIVSAAGNTNVANQTTILTGTTTQLFVMPNATTLALGQTFDLVNRSSGLLSVNSYGGAGLLTVPAGQSVHLVVSGIGTSAGTYAMSYSGSASVGSGTVLALPSNVSGAGAAAVAYTVTGIRTTDTILAVTGLTQGANNLPVLSFNTLIADGLTVNYVGNPGTGCSVLVAVLR